MVFFSQHRGFPRLLCTLKAKMSKCRAFEKLTLRNSLQFAATLAQRSFFKNSGVRGKDVTATLENSTSAAAYNAFYNYVFFL